MCGKTEPWKPVQDKREGMSISTVKETDTKQRDRVWIVKYYLGSAQTLKIVLTFVSLPVFLY